MTLYQIISALLTFDSDIQTSVSVDSFVLRLLGFK